MHACVVLLLLVAGGVLISGCTQQGPQGTAAPDFGVRNIPPATAGGVAQGGLVPGGAATGGAAGAASAGGSAAASGGAASASATTSGGLGGDIVNCARGTPWTYSGATSVGTWKWTWTIDGKASFKGGDYCKVTGTTEATGALAAYVPKIEYYFRVDPTGVSYSDIWYVLTSPGQAPQEVHIAAGTGGVTVSGSATTTSGTASVPTPSIPTSIGGIPIAAASGKPRGECEKYLTPAEGKAVWSANTWDYKSTETARTKSGLLAHRDDPNGVAGPSGEKYITASGLWCQYGGGGGTQFTYVIVTFPSAGSASTTGRNWGADPGDGTGLQGLDPTCQIYGAPIQEASEFGGPSCASSTVRDRFFIKGAKSVHVTCGDCTSAQLDSLAKTVAGRL